MKKLLLLFILLAWVSVTLAETVSEEAQRYMARGFAAVEMAKTPKDYERAVREFEQAAKLAPDWPDVYSNLGSVQAKAGNYGEAMLHYKRYLELVPNAPDAAKVREEIYKLEYRAEEEQRNLGSVQAKAGNYGEAMRHYKRYLELVPNAPDAAKVREEIYKLEYRAEEEQRVRNRFIAHSNETVLDTRTGLMWAAKDNGANIDWKGAKSYCENYRGGGYTDWRMPTQGELAGLYDSNKSYKATQHDYSVHLTELIQLSTCCPWASETRGSDAALFHFYVGDRHRSHQSYDVGKRALPVRSAQSILDSEKASVPSSPTGAYKGVRTYENGDKYEGEFTNRNLNGKGTYTYANGDKYVGEFVDGKFTSKGTFTCSNGKQFTGNLENKVPLEFTIRCN